MISPSCFMSFSASRAEVDVLVGQNWRVVLPCVSITRWPLFPCTACQIRPPKKKRTFKAQWTTYKNGSQMYKGEKRVWLYPARKGCRATLNRSAAVSSNLFDSRERWKKTLLNNLLCVSGMQDATWGKNSLLTRGKGYCQPACITASRFIQSSLLSEDFVHSRPSVRLLGLAL